MTHITEARVITNHGAMGRSTPAATDRPYLTVGEVSARACAGPPDAKKWPRRSQRGIPKAALSISERPTERPGLGLWWVRCLMTQSTGPSGSGQAGEPDSNGEDEESSPITLAAILANALEIIDRDGVEGPVDAPPRRGGRP
jgi:hypothetical protein